MEGPNPDDWLPEGWTVELRVRKNGKRDKYYFCPLLGLKFNSKVEVCRYLDSAQSKVSIQRISDNVVVEKSFAEGLPAGWMKKTRITTKGDTIRRDSIYIDPVSGYAFRSIKGAERYLDSGEIGKNAFKPKDNSSSYIELKDGKFSVRSASTTMKPTVSASLGQSSGLGRIANDQQIPISASSAEQMPMPISEHISSVVGTELISSALSQAESSAGFAKSAIASACTDECAQEKKLQENSEIKHRTENVQAQNSQCKNKHKKEINLPRRASKRLAGIKVDTPQALVITKSRTRQDAVKQSGEEETITNADKSADSLPHDLEKQFNELEGLETKCKSDANSTENIVSLTTKDMHEGVLENGDMIAAKLDYNLDVPLKELLTDPCIAFAIQTLTGVTFETSKDSQLPSEPKSSQHCETSASAEEHDKKINVLGFDSAECTQENFATPKEDAAFGGAHIDDKANENADPSSERTHDISWMDPCIEFAIKTLTGTIPVDLDQNPKTCFQQQLSSSNNQHNEMALSKSVNLDSLCQSDYNCSQYFGTQKPMFNQSFVDPKLQLPGNIGIGNSTGTKFPHSGENRSNVC